ncbi:sensor histidine kinase [Kribbella sp. NBC_00359]|uniref:sensor histidine kinase n=1 Tax=Kribbella sp. NBC_00359 TaxID=2975966 RepID=UPI002E24F068
MSTIRMGPAGRPVESDPLWRHPLVVRFSRIGQRLRQVDVKRPWVLDTFVVAGAFLVLCLPDLIHQGDRRELADVFPVLPTGAMLALQAGLILPLILRRRAPFAAFVAIAAVFCLQWSQSHFLRADAAILVALYSLTLHGRLRQLLWACGIMAGAIALVAVQVSAVTSLPEALFFLICAVTAAIALGLVVRIRRSQLAGLRERTAQLEIERDQRSMLAAAAERTRVAREMHDIVGHNLSVMITLADGGAYAAGVTPDRGAEALRLIGETGREAMGELRRMLGALREHTDAPQLSPQPGIADIDALCGRIRAAGPQVVYRTAGNVDTLDRGVQLAAYRIVQEALTNSLKHAGAETEALVSLGIADHRLRIRVQDSGPSIGAGHSVEPAGDGHGLIGMTERAALYGGTVSAGPGPGGGWIVRTELDLTAPTDHLETAS